MKESIYPAHMLGQSTGLLDCWGWGLAPFLPMFCSTAFDRSRRASICAIRSSFRTTTLWRLPLTTPPFGSNRPSSASSRCSAASRHQPSSRLSVMPVPDRLIVDAAHPPREERQLEPGRRRCRILACKCDSETDTRRERERCTRGSAAE